VRDGCSPFFHSNDNVDTKRLRSLPLNTGFVKDLLNHCFIPVRSPCSSELRKNVSSGVLFVRENELPLLFRILSFFRVLAERVVVDTLPGLDNCQSLAKQPIDNQ